MATLIGACTTTPTEVKQKVSILPTSTSSDGVTLFQGVAYQQEVRQVPRPLVIHIVTVDLTVTGVEVFVTPGDATKGLDLPARTTSTFLTEFGLQLAINGSFFTPFRSNGPENYYPHPDDPVDVEGLAISNGIIYSATEKDMAVLCILSNSHAEIQNETCSSDVTQAIAGNIILVNRGQPISSEMLKGDGLHPRTAVAIDKKGETLWLIVVDGRQPGYSEGLALVELAEGIRELGAYMALNLDGGGSTTLVTYNENGPYILNSPIDGGNPMQERAVANHLGIFARPIEH